MSTAKPASPSFDFNMPESRSSSSITNSRNGSPPLTSIYWTPDLRQSYDRPDRRIPHQDHDADTDRDRHQGERIEGRGIAKPADQKTGDDRPGRLTDIPNRPEHAHRGAETPRRGEIGNQRVGDRRHRGDAEAEK